MKPLIRSLVSAAALAFMLLLLPSTSAYAASTDGGPTAVTTASRPAAAQLASLPRASSRVVALRPMALINCYHTSVRGIYHGMTGVWHYLICYDNVRCVWVIVSASFVPDPCRPGKPC